MVIAAAGLDGFVSALGLVGSACVGVSLIPQVVRTVRAGHARPLLQKRCVTLASSAISCPGVPRAPALLPFGFPRATHAVSCPTDATAAPNDPDFVR